MVRTSTGRQGAALGPSLALRAGGFIALLLADECPLAAPSQLITAQPRSVVSHTFAMPSARETREVVQLKGGGKLQVNLSGCEYVVMAIRYETKGPWLATADARGAYRLAADALAALASTRAATVFDLVKAEKALRRAAAGSATPKPSEEIPVPDGMEPPPYVSVERWGTEASHRRFVEVRLVWGPA